MPRADETAGRAAGLRSQAEARAREKLVTQHDTPGNQFPETEGPILHELRVHQIELEMQNEELRQAYQELDIARSRYFGLYDLAPVGYCTLGENGLIQEVNLTAANLLGVARSMLVGRHLSRFISPKDADVYHRLRQLLLKTGEPQDCELLMVKNDGSEFCVRLSATVAADDMGAPLHLVTLSDITRQKRADEKARLLDERITQIQKFEALGVLTAGVAHTMNNVLAAILSTSSVRETLATEAADRESFGMIVKACKRGRDVLKSLLHFSRSEIPDQTPLELHTLIDEVCALLEVTTMNRIDIVKAGSGEPLWITGDAGSLTHALMNLCLNALDALPDRGILTLRTSIPDKFWVELSVQDTGCGMTPEILSHVLEPFYTTKPVGKGTGLGLSMAYGVIKAHGGTLAISSQPDKGTVVTIRLPRIPGPAATPVVEKAIVAPSQPLSPLEVLLVDDDEDVLFLMTRMLETAGLRVRSTDSGEKCLEILCSGPVPDLVILDQNMPGMSGIQTMERIRKLYPDMAILISSGQLDIEEWECFKQPNVAVISKPFDLEEIKTILARFGGTSPSAVAQMLPHANSGTGRRSE